MNTCFVVKGTFVKTGMQLLAATCDHSIILLYMLSLNINPGMAASLHDIDDRDDEQADDAEPGGDQANNQRRRRVDPVVPLAHLNRRVVQIVHKVQNGAARQSTLNHLDRWSGGDQQLHQLTAVLRARVEEAVRCDGGKDQGVDAERAIHYARHHPPAIGDRVVRELGTGRHYQHVAGSRK